MGLLDFFFGKRDSLTIGENSLSFEIYKNPDYLPKAGEMVNLWNKPNSSIVNIYAKGSVDGEGKLGARKDKELWQHLEKGGVYQAKVVHLTSTSLLLNVNIKREFITIEDQKASQKIRWQEELSKKYNPNTDWKLRFIIRRKFDKKSVIILGHNDFETAILNIDNLQDQLWLLDSNCIKISDENRSGYSDTVKTLKAIYSDHKLELTYLETSGVYSSFKVRKA